MSRRKAFFLLLPFALVIGAVVLFSFLPKRYKVGERLTQTVVFWNDQEAFLFLDVNITGQSSNIVQEKLAATKYGFWTLLATRGPAFYENGVTAYHLLPSAEMQRFALPPRTASYGIWTLVDGKLQLTPVATGFNDRKGFRWDGKGFVSVSPEPRTHPQPGADSRLAPDDVSDDEGQGPAYLGPSSRKMFKNAGWHTKMLTGYEGNGTEATLPIQMGSQTFDLTIRSLPISSDHTPQFDLLSFGPKSIEISGDGFPQNGQVLWSQNGWREISRNEFELRAQQSGRSESAPVTIWVWLAVFLLVMSWKFFGWAHFLFNLFSMKRRVLKNMATSYSFPSATPAQFPSLDAAALDRYTREFESKGFTRLLDFSLAADTPNHPANFCRLFAHGRHHCFGEVSQIFPRGKAPMALKCSIQSCLQDGWTITFSDRKPQPASSLLRRTKSLSVSMPEASTGELLQAFLKLRDQVCMDLGISPMKDDTLEAYIAKVQLAARDMRTAVRERNFAKGISQVYYRKLSLLKSRPEYIWLGDYPKQAETRRQGYTYGASTAPIG